MFRRCTDANVDAKGLRVVAVEKRQRKVAGLMLVMLQG